MNDLGRRLITGTIFVAVTVATIRWSPGLFSILFFVFNAIAVIEFSRLLRKMELQFNMTLLVVAGILMYLALAFPSMISVTGIEYWPWSLLVPFLIPVYQILPGIPQRQKGAVFTLTGISVIAIPLGILNFFNPIFGNNPWLPEPGHFLWEYLLGFFILLWTHDSLAYLTGRLMGKTKLAPQISPNKTWEGSIGGTLFAIGAGLIYQQFIGGDPLFWMLSGVIIALGSTFGDLGISALKRRAKVKDTGSILPGHGGVLDRMDGVLISAPLFYCFINIWLQLT